MALSKTKRAWLQFAVNIAIFSAVIFLFASQLDSLSDSFGALRQADVPKVLLALLAVMLTYPVAALSYTALSDTDVRLRSTVYIQMASGFVNRVLPIGLGNLGLYGAYFHKLGFNLPAATALVATNNILGVIGNLVLAAAVLAFEPKYFSSIRFPHMTTGIYIVFAAMLAAAVIAVLIGRSKRQSKAVRSVVDTLRDLRQNLQFNHRTIRSLFYNMSLTSLYAFVLSTVAAAVGGHLPWPAALLVLSLGTLIGVLVPTPGGIGGVEAGLLTGMLAFGVAGSAGLAAVLLYRALTYWLPIVPGVVMLKYIEGKYI